MLKREYIERGEAFGAVQEHFQNGGFKSYADGQACLERIKDIPAADVEPKRKWISVTKSLPKQSGVYRVCGHRRGLPMVSWECEFWILSTMNGGGWLNGAGRPCVEYWLPNSEIPELPKGEDDGTCGAE